MQCLNDLASFLERILEADIRDWRAESGDTWRRDPSLQSGYYFKKLRAQIFAGSVDNAPFILHMAMS